MSQPAVSANGWMDELAGTPPVVLSQKLVWNDMDANQHINNVVYFRFFEDVRIEYFSKIGVLEQMESSNAGPILASTRCDFRAPLTFPDAIQVTANVTEIHHNRFTMTHTVYSEKLGKIAAQGEALIVYYDYALGKSCGIPAVIVNAIENLQQQIPG